MNKIADFLVNKRKYIFVFTLLITVISLFLLNKVNINYDMTEYLSDDSSMKQGLDIMEEEFPDVDISSIEIKIMATDLTDLEKQNLLENIQNIINITSVSYDDTEEYNKDNYTLYIATTNCEYSSDEFKTILEDLDAVSESYDMIYETDKTSSGLTLPIYLGAFAILLIVLCIMSSSWILPLLFLFDIFIAIIINMGTNAFLPSVSNTTYSIAAVLQLILSMDYAIIFINRYKQQQDKTADNIKAMKKAISSSAPSIFSSSLTTIVGLLALSFMSYKIGLDMGIVLAKGVLISMLCIFLIMPAVTLLCDKIIKKTEKKVPNFKMNKLSEISYKYRYVITIVFVLLFALLLTLKDNAPIVYNMEEKSEIQDVFEEEDTIILLYNNNDEKQISNILDEENTTSYSTTIGKQYTKEEMSNVISIIDEETIELIYNYNNSNTLSIEQLINIVYDLINDDIYQNMFTDEDKELIENYKITIEEAKDNLVGENYSLATITITNSKSIENLETDLDGLEHYLIGEGAMAYEMGQTFNYELNKITLITAIAIFIVVLLTFKNIIIPFILVLLIQTSVYATMCILGLAGIDMYYLALIIVQSILMGATVDYAILFTNYYKEQKSKNAVNALKQAYKNSLGTILTSSLIMILVTFILGFAFEDPAIGQICHIISLGVTCAVVLILFILPSLLSLFDKYIRR